MAGRDPRLDALTTLVPDDARTGSLSAVAYYLIRDLVVTLELAPGSPVEERTLMQRLGLGRTPVREALRRLSDEGLVTVYARRGMVVAPVDARDLASISEVRVELEGYAARLAADRATAPQRAAAADLMAELALLSDEQDERALIRFDQRVHHHVYRCTHNAYLVDTLMTYLTLSLRLWHLGLEHVQRLDEAIHEHRALLHAVESGDPATAERVARTHVTGFQDEIRQVLTLPR